MYRVYIIDIILSRRDNGPMIAAPEKQSKTLLSYLWSTTARHPVFFFFWRPCRTSCLSINLQDTYPFFRGSLFLLHSLLSFPTYSSLSPLMLCSPSPPSPSSFSLPISHVPLLSSSCEESSPRTGLATWSGLLVPFLVGIQAGRASRFFSLGLGLPCYSSRSSGKSGGQLQSCGLFLCLML